MIVKLQHGADNYTGNVLYSIDNKGYTSKPKGGEIGAIRNRLAGTAAHTETSIQRLAQELETGHTIQGAQLQDKANQEDKRSTDERFIQQQLFFVDIDNDYKGADGKKYRRENFIGSLDEIIEISHNAGIEPCILK